MNGILPLWKPKGLTSHDCVYRIRKLTGIKKVGHTGTLDPEVEGVLPICIGQATKISEIIMESQKVYIAEVTLGKSTETEDQEGKIVEQKEVPESLQIADIKEVLSDFEGEIEQVPPMFSAIKIKGKKLYEYARAGIKVERPKRVVTIHSIDLLSEQLVRHDDGTASFKIKVACSKGTYIRTLCVNIGEALHIPAHMSHLIRVESGSFTEKDAVTFEQIEQIQENHELTNFVKTIDEALESYEVLVIDEDEQQSFKNGQVLPLSPKVKSSPFKVKTNKGELLALYQIHPTKPLMMKPFKMFLSY